MMGKKLLEPCQYKTQYNQEGRRWIWKDPEGLKKNWKAQECTEKRNHEKRQENARTRQDEEA